MIDPSNINSPIGAQVRCDKCPQILDAPNFDWRSEKTPGEQYGVLAKVAEKRGWRHGTRVVMGQTVAAFTCPACFKQAEEAKTRVLPRYDCRSKCSACGSSGEVGTKFCTGLPDDCELGAVRDHLHRTCGNCGKTWIEACLDDPIGKAEDKK